MSRSRRRSVRLEAYRQLYSAVCSLGDALYEEALAVSEDERDAAFAASCALVSRLERERSPQARRGLLGRIDALPRASARRRSAGRRPSSAPSS